MSPLVTASALSWSTRALAADCIAGILPSSAIEPVTSSTSATRMRTLPQVAVEEVLKFMFGKPATRMKSVTMEPEPSSLMAAGAEPLGVV